MLNNSHACLGDGNVRLLKVSCYVWYAERKMMKMRYFNFKKYFNLKKIKKLNIL